MQRTHLTVKEAAHEACMSAAWLYARIRAGTGPGNVKRGRRVLIPRGDWDSWIARAIL